MLPQEVVSTLSTVEAPYIRDWARRVACQLNRTAQPTERLGHAIRITDRAIRLIDDGVSIGEVCDRLNMSHTWLTASTKMATGLRPYELVRLRRFRKIARDLHAGVRHSSDADDFADQAHLIREFCKLSRNTPVSYARSYTPYPGHIVESV